MLIVPYAFWCVFRVLFQVSFLVCVAFGFLVCVAFSSTSGSVLSICLQGPSDRACARAKAGQYFARARAKTSRTRYPEHARAKAWRLVPAVDLGAWAARDASVCHGHGVCAARLCRASTDAPHA